MLAKRLNFIYNGRRLRKREIYSFWRISPRKRISTKNFLKGLHENF
jgi:hypothetical protein